MNENESSLRLLAAFSMVSADRAPLSCTISGRPIPPGVAATLSPEIIAIMREHFWCDFSDVIPSLTWDAGDTDHCG
jgi:hypothetical protein